MRHKGACYFLLRTVKSKGTKPSQTNDCHGNVKSSSGSQIPIIVLSVFIDIATYPVVSSFRAFRYVRIIVM